MEADLLPANPARWPSTDSKYIIHLLFQLAYHTFPEKLLPEKGVPFTLESYFADLSPWRLCHWNTR